MLNKLIVPVIATAALSAPAWADGEGNAERGAAYAAAMCSSCHAVTADGASPNPAAKPFRAVSLADATGDGFSTWLNTKHPNISGHMIKVGQAEDIAALIASLKAKEG